MGSDTLPHPYRKVNKKCSTAILVSALGAKGSWVAEVYWRRNPRCSSAQFFLERRSKFRSRHPTPLPYRKVNKKYCTAIILSVLGAKEGRVAVVYLRKNTGCSSAEFIFFKESAKLMSDTLPHHLTEKLIKKNIDVK